MTHETVGPGSLLKRRMLYLRDRAASALAVLVVTAGTVHADVRVSGDARAIRLDTTQSNVAEVLSALESAFQLRVNTPTALDKPVGGTYTGSLAQVLSRILEGYSYFIRWRSTEIEVTVIAGQGERAAAVQRPRLPPGISPAMSLSDAVRLKVQ